MLPSCSLKAPRRMPPPPESKKPKALATKIAMMATKRAKLLKAD
eukprot:CAMPEP_0183531818 /NCGR_PEP_ID=MMETSP0371-20130417/25095_1 /TAXON_ID=268820 /ORGANISM="Peridinium aciculiferum, Strain PAER-2" /LENGTH=43 /DNA_ID= /DNA_START= /DNA_END= /DNA_ORIENTATION=